MLAARRISGKLRGGGVSGMKIGINQSDLAGWQYATPFVERFHGSPNTGPNLRASMFGSDLGLFPSANLDSVQEKWPKTFPSAGECAMWTFYPEPSTRYTMYWDGNFVDATTASMNLNGATQVAASYDAVNRTVQWDIASTVSTNGCQLTYTFDTTGGNYVRNIRFIKNGDSTAVGALTPQYVTEINKYTGTLRFTKWLPQVERNGGVWTAAWGGGTAAAPVYAILWANRNTPTSTTWQLEYNGDGVPVEIIVSTANGVTCDAVHIPITSMADDDYITRFATYVRDNLDVSKIIYIEIDNEVWNSFYDANHRMAAEAADPAVSATYPVQGGDGTTPTHLRYIHVCKRVHDIWLSVFQAGLNGNGVDQRSRLKPMLCCQHAQTTPFSLALAYAQTQGWLANIKAYATAPYWSAQGLDATFTGTAATFFAAAKLGIDAQAVLAASHKAICTTYGFEYVTYEGSFGHDLNDLTTLTAIKTDPLMYDYTLYYLQKMDPYLSRITMFMFCGPLGVPDGIYGHIFPSLLGATYDKAHLPERQAIIDYQAGTRKLFAMSGTMSDVQVGTANGTTIGTATKSLSDSTIALQSSSPSGAFSLNTSTGVVTLTNTSLITGSGPLSVTIRETNPKDATGFLDTVFSFNAFTFGAELWSNGNFSAAAPPPTLGSGCTISGGVLNCSGGAQLCWETGITVVGHTYRMTGSYTMSAGSKLRANNSTTNGAAILATSPALGSSGTFQFDFTATGTAISIEADSAVFTGTIDNISVKEKI